MSNMSYCRFENTARDLADCAEHIHDGLTDNTYEAKARLRLIGLCKSILQDVGFEIKMSQQPEFQDEEHVEE
jgi:hypothetical protein